LRKSPSSDSGQSTPASPIRPTIQGRHRLPALPSTKPWCRSPPDNTAAYKPGVGAGESLGTSPTPSSNNKKKSGRPSNKTNREWSEVAAQLRATANETSRMFERYIASLDGTLKELKPCMEVIERT